MMGGPGDRSSDQLHLLEHTASISKNTTRDEDEFNIYEMVDFDSSDIGVQKNPMLPLRPPEYSSMWDRELRVAKRGSDSRVEDFSPTLHGQSSFDDATTPLDRRWWHGFFAYVRRSGRYASHVSYDYVNSRATDEYRRFSGWRGGILAATVSSGTVLLINIIFTAWAAAKSGSGVQVGTIYAGECAVVSAADSRLHIAINVMGTILLGASNFTMQCLTAPTRKQVDTAHAKGKYLDIGLPSPKNLSGWKKKILFTLLVLSTVPLHFLWNSAVFTTTQELDYNVFVVTPNFLTSSSVNCAQNVSVQFGNDQQQAAVYYNDRTPLNYSSLPDKQYYDSDNYWWQEDVCNVSIALHTNYTQNKLVKLTNKECIDTYGRGNDLLDGWGNLLVVTKEQPANSSITMLMQFRYEYYISNYTGQNWVCDPQHLTSSGYTCKYKDIAADSDAWTMGIPASDPSNDYLLSSSSEQWLIDYCLAQPTDISGMCQLQYSLIIMIIILIANGVKFSCIIFVTLTHLEPILATIGDGIATFLERPDRFTAFRPFLDRKHARWWRNLPPKRPVKYKPPKRARRWWHGPSPTRWTLTFILCSIAIAAVSGLLSMANEAVLSNGDGSSPYSLGFGIYNSAATLNIFPTSNGDLTAADFSSNKILIAMVMVANLPQVIVSCLYFAYNTVYTSMVSADEWSRFTHTRKALRTTDPKGEQRSTYWLSLPWTYALPLAIASSVLHWLISQSLFVARTEILNADGNPEPLSYMEVGYSPLAIVIALLFGTGMVLAMVVNGTRKLKGGVMVGNNSLAISAACHRSEGDFRAEKKRVRWGALHHQLADGTPGHCCFSSEAVEEPRVGDLYI